MTTRWPGILRPTSILFEPSIQTRSGGLTISGLEQIVVNDAGRWKATLNIMINTRQKVKAWRSLNTTGRAGTFLVPVCGSAASPSEPWSDGTYFTDGYGFSSTTFTIATAAQGATTVFITRHGSESQSPEPGDHFSVEERLYRVVTVEEDTDPFEVTIWPPLRDPIFLINQKAEFDQPICRMRFATDDSMDMMLSMLRFSEPTVSFVEVV